MRWHEIVSETASGGATASGNVASVVGSLGTARREQPLGAGFDPNGDYGIYEKPKKKSKK